MEYSVIIKNDSRFSNGDGIVHTWLEFNATGDDTQYFGFSPKKDSGYFNVDGAIDKNEYLKERHFSESITLKITKEQYDKMLDTAKTISKNVPVYDLMPDRDHGPDYNCTTMANYVLESGGVYFLSGVQSPFGVAGRISGIAADVTDIKITENGDVIINSVSPLTTLITLDVAIEIKGENYDIGLIESSLDAKDLIDEVVDDIYGKMSEYVRQLDGNASTAMDMNDILNGFNASRDYIKNVIDTIGNSLKENSELLLRELVAYYQKGLQNTANVLAHLLNGGVIPLDKASKCLLPPGISYPGMMLPGFIPPGTCGPDMATPEKTTSPIILDLDGDGIETRGLQDGIFFDHDGNQFAENTGWVGADDGLLVLDRNNNGEIDTGQELFGSNTRLNDGSLAKNGYSALQELDSNQDGIINQDDEAWQQLQVWQDRNGNASVDEGELLSLEDAGIAAINTGYKNSNLVDKQGNAHKQTGTVIMQDGTINQSADVWFAANMGNTRYISDVDIPRNIRQLPYIRGFGNMADLHVAMSENAELRALIEQFIADPLSPEVDSLLQNIIFTWAGVNDIASDSRGDYIDARYLAVLEVATGDNYQNITNGTVNPLRNAGALLNKEYAKFVDYIQASLLAQTVYREDFSHIGLQINSEANGLTLNFEAFEAHLNTLKKTDIGRYLSVSHVFYDQLTYMPAFADERERLGIAGDKIFSGGDGDDVLRDNYLSGNRTDDYFWGAAGNDTLDGGYGSDTYLFNAGDGQDTIIEGHSYSNDIDRLILGEGLLVENTRLARTGSDLWITFEGGTDSLRLKNYFRSDSISDRVEEIVFADGTVWDVETVKAMLIAGTDDAQTLWAYEPGTEIHAGGGNDEVWGNKGADRLYGDEGNDGLSAGDGNDLLAGGTGNDWLTGGYGSDTYLFNAGDGQDAIVESYSDSHDIDRLVLGEGLLAENARLTRTGRDLLIRFVGSSDSLCLKDYFRSDSARYRVEEIVFADGTVWDVETVKAMLIVGTDDAQTLWAYEPGSEIHGGGGDDEIWGNEGADCLFGDEGNDGLSAGDGNDLLAGGTGNDWLTGGYGSDTYLFNAGDGQDTIVENYGNSHDIDRLILGDGLLAENARLTRTANDLWITFGDGTDSLRLKNYFRNDSVDPRVEEIVFADGTVWDAERVKAMLIVGTDDAQTLWAYEPGSELHAGGGNDEVWGNKGADHLYGDEGDDGLSAGDGNDLLVGGAGNDWLTGGYGSDTYLFNAGDGQDTIVENYSDSHDIDRLVLGEGLLAENARLTRTGRDLLIRFVGSSDSLCLKDYFRSDSARYRVEEIVFADGTVWNVETVKAMLIVGTDDAQTLWAYEPGSEIHGGGGDDEIWGNEGADCLFGDEGNDGLSAGDGNDLLVGGTGNDWLTGGYGSDTYLFNAGDGQDTIVENYSRSDDIDRLVLGEGLLAENTRLTRTANDLWITFGDGTDSLRLKNYFRSDSISDRVEEIVFADGTVWDVETVKAMLIAGTDDAQTLWAYEPGTEIHAGGGDDEVWGNKGADRLYGDEGNDGLSAGDGNDLLAGGTGNDWLTGGYGSDTYLFNAGDGQDTIVESYSSGSDSDTLRFGAEIQAGSAIVQRNGNDLLIGFDGSTDSVTIKSYFASSKYQVEHITFADGTDWLPEDILNHLEDGIQLPLAAPAEAPVSLQQMRELMATFSGGDEGSEDSVGDATPTLSTSRTTVRSLMCA